MGMTPYQKALEFQLKLLELRRRGEIGDVLLLLEHPPVITIGYRDNSEHILAGKEFLAGQGIGVFKTNRGGDVTYHGPGQIVGYPIMDLRGMGGDIRGFVWKLEEVFIRLLKDEYGIFAERGGKGYTGVWAGGEKIAAIGIAVKEGVTMHGFAFNVNTRLEHFRWIVPCGIPDRGVTSLEKILGIKQDMEKVYRQVREFFCRIFGRTAESARKGLDLKESEI